MSRMPAGDQPRYISPTNNVYTALLAAATVAGITAFVILYMQFAAVFSPTAPAPSNPGAPSGPQANIMAQ